MSLISADYETYNLKYVLALAKRFHSQGYRIYLDYRKYADPSTTLFTANDQQDFSDCRIT